MDRRPGLQASDMTGQRHLTEPRSFKLPAGGMWGGICGGMCGLKPLSETVKKAIAIRVENCHLVRCYELSDIL